MPEGIERRKKENTEKTKNHNKAALLGQQSKVVGERKIDDVESALRMTFVHLLYDLRVPCPATSKDRLFPFSFRGRCR